MTELLAQPLPCCLKCRPIFRDFVHGATTTFDLTHNVTRHSRLTFLMTRHCDDDAATCRIKRLAIPAHSSGRTTWPDMYGGARIDCLLI